MFRPCGTFSNQVGTIDYQFHQYLRFEHLSSKAVSIKMYLEIVLPGNMKKKIVRNCISLQILTKSKSFSCYLPILFSGRNLPLR